MSAETAALIFGLFAGYFIGAGFSLIIGAGLSLIIDHYRDHYRTSIAYAELMLRRAKAREAYKKSLEQT